MNYSHFELFKIIGASTLVVEKKFIHECGKVGRVEDVVVSVSFYLVSLTVNDISMELMIVKSYDIKYIVNSYWKKT